MSAHLLSGLLSFVVFAAACNQKKFDGAVASRNPPPKVQQEEDSIPAEKPPVVVTETVTLPAGPMQPTTEPPKVEPPKVEPPKVEPPKVEPPKVEPIPEADKSIEFGASEIFRIGDGFASSGSNCVGQVNTYKLSGTKYYFQFEIMEDDTQVDLSIGRICGVDQVVKDTFSLLNEQSKHIVLPEKALPKQMEIGPTAPWVPYPAFKLNKGVYSVVIHSKNIYGKEVAPGTPIDPSKDEHDDFLVGNIKLKANKQVKAIKISAE